MCAACVCVQVNLSTNQVCGLNDYGEGKYTAEGINAIADALHVSGLLTKVLAFLIAFMPPLNPCVIYCMVCQTHSF